MIFLSHFILAFVAAIYALHVPTDSHPADSHPDPDLSVPADLMVVQRHAGLAVASDMPTSRMSARQNSCPDYGTPSDPTKTTCLAPVCLTFGSTICGPYCQNGANLTLCLDACAPNPMPTCGQTQTPPPQTPPPQTPPPQTPPPQSCTPEIGQCTTFAIAVITQNWTPDVVAVVSSLLPDAQGCLADLLNNLPLLTCLGSCGQPGNSELQAVEGVVSCVFQFGVPNSCVSFLGDVIITALADSSLAADEAIVIFIVEAVVCLIQKCPPT